MDLRVQFLWQMLHQLLKCERTTVGRWNLSEHFHIFPYISMIFHAFPLFFRKILKVLKSHGNPDGFCMVL